MRIELNIFMFSCNFLSEWIKAKFLTIYSADDITIFSRLAFSFMYIRMFAMIILRIFVNGCNIMFF